MRRSKVDRVAAGPRGNPEVISVEVYLPAGDDNRGGVSSGRRYLGLAAAVAVVLIALVLVSSLSSRGVHKPAPSSATPMSAKDSLSRPSGTSYGLLLVSLPDVPRNARQLMHHDRCAGSRSAALERAVETLYAAAVAEAKGEVLPGRAKLQATEYPRC